MYYGGSRHPWYHCCRDFCGTFIIAVIPLNLEGKSDKGTFVYTCTNGYVSACTLMQVHTH